MRVLLFFNYDVHKLSIVSYPQLITLRLLSTHRPSIYSLHSSPECKLLSTHRPSVHSLIDDQWWNTICFPFVVSVYLFCFHRHALLIDIFNELSAHFPRLGTYVSMKSGGAKLVLCAQSSRYGEMTQQEYIASHVLF